MTTTKVAGLGGISGRASDECRTVPVEVRWAILWLVIEHIVRTEGKAS